MVQNYVQNVMESMGGFDNFQMPIANYENKNLLELIDELINNKAEREVLLRESDERVDKLQAHAKNAETDIEQNLKLLFAQQSQVTCENHMHKLAERECSKLQSDIRGFEKELTELNNYDSNTLKEITKKTQNIETSTNKIEWAKSALVEWNRAINDADDANKMIEKYCKQDEKKAKLLDGQRQQTQNAVCKNRLIMISLHEEQKSLEQELDRTANLYRESHQQRRQMVNTWKIAVNQMNQREEHITFTEKEIDNWKQKNEKKLAELKFHDDQLNKLKSENHDIELNIEELNNESSELKERLQMLTDLVSLKENEVDIIRKDLQGLCNQVQQQRRENRQTEQTKVDRQILLEKYIENSKKIEERFEKMKNKNFTAAQRLEMLDEIVETEERAKTLLAQEIANVNSLLFRSEQQFNTLVHEAKTLKMENEGIEVSTALLRKNNKRLEELILHKTEIKYNMSFKLYLVEKKITAILGNENPEEMMAAEYYFSKLEKQCEKAVKHLSTLQLQTMRLDEEMSNQTKIYNRDIKVVEELTSKIKEAQLYRDGGTKELKLKTSDNQKKIVELSMLKMRVNEFEKLIAKSKDKSYTLGKHRLLLEKTYKDRMIDIKTQTNLLQLKRKHLCDERSTLKMDIGERKKRIEAVKLRYELDLEILGQNEDGSIVTPTQLKVESAQEKQMLLHEGNELNEKVIKAESEIKAMENTLCLLNYSNGAYRKTFEQLDDESPDFLELKRLETEQCKYLHQLKKVKCDSLQRKYELDELMPKHEYLKEQLNIKEQNRLDHKDILNKIHKELLEQKVKIQRAERELNCALKVIRQRPFCLEFLLSFEKNLDLQDLERKNQTAINMISDVLDTELCIGPRLRHLLCEKCIELPHMKRCKGSFSWRSDYSDISITSSSRDKCTTSSVSSTSIKTLEKTNSSTSRSLPSVISIDFPPDKEVFLASTQ